MSDNNARSVFYSKSHVEIVEQGFHAISNVLNGEDTSEKESLLLCLDKYMDPYYGLKLPDREKIEKLLQQVIINQNTIGVKEDALDLLTSYSRPPFETLQNNLDEIEPGILPDVLYALNMNKNT